MDVLEAVRKRVTVGHFEEKKVPDDVLRKLARPRKLKRRKTKG